jgi:hypothetical protein
MSAVLAPSTDLDDILPALEALQLFLVALSNSEPF